MEKMYLSGHQRGILELACRAFIAPFEGIFGMKKVYCEDENQENEQEGNVESFSVQRRHRILCAYNIRKRQEKSQPTILLYWFVFVNGVKPDFESSIHRKTRCSVTFDQFVSLIQDVIHAEVKLNTRENIPG